MGEGISYHAPPLNTPLNVVLHHLACSAEYAEHAEISLCKYITAATLAGDGLCVICGKTVCVVIVGFGSVSASHGNRSLLSCLLNAGFVVAGVFNTLTVCCCQSFLLI